MMRTFPAALLPICCLALTASVAHLFNRTREAESAPDAPAAVSHPVSTLPDQDAVEDALRQVIRGYQKSGFASLQERTTEERWRNWQMTPTGERVEHRLRMLATWPAISLREPQVRSSGHIEFLATCGEDQLKVWMTRREGRWKLIGIVSPPRPE